MKALKEKRVSLRSLFRRSLVILSLLALAFAFASCSSDSGGGGEGPIEPTTEPPTTTTGGPAVEPLKTIMSMTVLTHPNRPSFEGAAPDLTGLEVMVRWNNGEQERIKGDDERLTVHPPVAYVIEPGEHAYFRQYTVQYKGKDTYNLDAGDVDSPYLYNDPVYGAKVWIPVVIALVDDEDQDVVGTIAEVFEDLGVTDQDAKGLAFTGNYASFEHGTDWGHGFTPDQAWPVDYYNAGTGDIDDNWTKVLGFSEEDWDAAADQKKFAKSKGWYEEDDDFTGSNPILSDPRAWKIAHKEDVTDKDGAGSDQVAGTGVEKDKLVQQTPKALYLSGLNRPQTASVLVEEFIEVEIGKFYWVDRFDFNYNDNIAEMKKIQPKAADDPTYGGNNVKWTVDVKPTSKAQAWIEDVGEDVQIAWMWLLYDAKLKFKVIYYDAGGTSRPTRDITMLEYIRAMHTVDEYGTPKATLPIFTGSPASYERYGATDTTDDRGNLIKNPSSPQYWALNDGDYPLYMTLFYYSDLIMPARVKAGDPEYRLDPTGDYTTSVKGRGKVRPQAYVLNGNGAQIPLANDNVHKVAQFASFDRERKETTAHPGNPGGEPTILGTFLNPDREKATETRGFPYVTTGDNKTGVYKTRMELYNQLQKYWDGIWLYDSQDPDWPNQIPLPVSRWYTFDGVMGGPLTNGNNWAATTQAAQTLDYEYNRGPSKLKGGVDIRDKYQFIGLADYDLDEIEDEETRTLEVLFPAPPSVGPGEDDSVEFDYFVKP